jgi:hypothetical protein
MRTAVILLVLGLALPAFAADEDLCPSEAATPEVPPALMTELTGWIALHTMYDVRELATDPPEIRFCAVGSVIDYEGADLRIEPELRAAYDLPNRVVHLVLPWSAENPIHRSVLLHELVHDVQLSNREWDCVGQPELEAYTLQALYLEALGIIPDFDWAAIRRLSTCPETDQL